MSLNPAPKSPPPPRFSAVVPVHNGAGYLIRMLPVLQDAVAALHGEILVVDDGSSDGSGMVAQRLGLEPIVTGARLGAGPARNLGAAHARGATLVFVDADVVPHADTIRGLLAHLDSGEYSAAFGSYDADCPEHNFASLYQNLRHHFYHQRAKHEADSFWCGLGAVTKSAFEEVGGFDDRYEGIEDVEFGTRLRAAGHKIRLDPSCLGTHLKRWTLYSAVYSDIVNRAIPWSRLLCERRETPGALNTRLAERLRAIGALVLILSFLFAAATGTAWAVVATAALIVCLANLDFAIFMARRRGFAFAMTATVYHQIYYLYSSAVYAYCRMNALSEHGEGRVVRN